MIMLKDLLKEMGIIEEAVLMTHDTDSSIDILDGIFNNTHYSLSFSKRIGSGNTKNLHRIIGKFEDLSNWDNRSWKLLNMYMYNLGYYPSYYNTKDSFKWNKYDENINKKNIFEMIFDILHDISIDPLQLPNVAYHVTPSKHEEKIIKLGLTPKSIEKFEKHSDRIYFGLKPEDINTLLHNERFTRNEKLFSIFKINPSQIHKKNTKIQFAEDRSFLNHAIYTLYNIHPDDIQLVKSKINIEQK